MFITGDTYLDIDGNEFTNLDQIFPNVNINVEFDMRTFATIPIFFWASKKISFLGNANYLGGYSFNYVTGKASFLTKRDGVIIDTSLMRSYEVDFSGLGDMYFLPLGLSWGLEQFDLTFMYSITAPTGAYEPGAVDNLGLGFWTHQFQGFGYYYPNPNRTTAIMLGATYELNGKIRDTDVKPGNRFSLEYGISQYLSRRLELTAQGGHNWQVGDDSGEDVYWDSSLHDQKYTAAFSINYWVWEGHLSLAFKYGFDYGARMRMQTNYYMLNLLIVPNILTGK